MSCPTSLGQITILPGHIPLVGNLVPGELVIKSGNSELFLNVTGGFVEVRPNNQIVILADAAEHHYEIDEQRAKEAVERAKKAMTETKLSAQEHAQVTAALERSLARLNVAKKHAHRKTPITGEGVFNE